MLGTRVWRRGGWEAVPLPAFVAISLVVHVGLLLVAKELGGRRRMVPFFEFVAVDLVELEPTRATERTRDAASPRTAVPAPEWRPDKVQRAQAQPVQTTERAQEGKRSSLELDVDFPFLYYLSVVRNKISSNWLPPRASSGKEPIRTKVFFLISRDGRVNQVALEVSSGISFFDQSALRAIYASDPLPPLPEEFPDAELGVHFTFEFVP